MARNESFFTVAKPFWTSNFFSESNFDKEVEALLLEFDEKCEKLWKEEDTAIQNFGKASLQRLPPSTPKPSIKMTSAKPRNFSVKTTTNSSDNKGTYRSELHVKEFPKKKSAPRFLGILKQEKTLTSDKFEIDIDITGFE